jgi:hypothetical protein
MATTIEGLRVQVQGDLPAEVMQRVAERVRRAVLHELAELDLTDLTEVPLTQPASAERDLGLRGPDVIGLGIPILLGLWLKPPGEVFPGELRERL